MELPEGVLRLLHDCDPTTVRWEEHRGFLVDRILGEGDWETIRWLRRTAGDAVIREWILETKGRRLEPRQLRLWQLLLDLPEEEVTAWLRDPRRAVWDGRSARTREP
jgi:hypothetical protein